MRYYEICDSPFPTSDPLLEGFLDSIFKRIGNRMQQAITTVTDTTTALAAIGQCTQNDTVRFNITYRLRKWFSQWLSTVQIPALKTLLNRLLPRESQSGGAFTIMLVLTAIMNVCLNAAAWAKSNAVDAAKGQITDYLVAKLPQVTGMFTGLSLDPAGIFKILQALGVANTILFNTLNQIVRANKKWIGGQVAPQKTPAQANQLAQPGLTPRAMAVSTA